MTLGEADDGASGDRRAPTGARPSSSAPGPRLLRAPSLRLRTAGTWALIAVALSAILAALAFAVTRQELVSERERTAVERAYLNARSLRSALRTADPDIGEVLASLESNSQARVLADVGGTWYAATPGSTRDALPPSLVEAVATGSAGRQRQRVDGVPYLAVGVPVVAADARYFEIVSMEDLQGALDGLRTGLIVAAGAAAATAGLVGWYASGRVLSPLRRFAEASTRIAAGELDARLPTVTDRDLQSIERSFNGMAEAVQERVDREIRFTSNVSHELRSPVISMLSMLSIARRNTRDPETAARAIDDLEVRVRALHATIDDLLEISRAEAGVASVQLEPVDPVRLVQAVLAHRDLELPVTTVGSIGPIDLDKRRVGQMLENLIDNAAHYAGGATRIEIVDDGSEVRLMVDDDGPGVPEHERSYVFERFARGDSAASARADGSGLGLALVVEHARLHGGSVRVEGAPGGGARFVVTLPRKGSQ